MSLRPRSVSVVATDAKGDRLALLVRLGHKARKVAQTAMDLPALNPPPLTRLPGTYFSSVEYKGIQVTLFNTSQLVGVIKLREQHGPRFTTFIDLQYKDASNAVITVQVELTIDETGSQGKLYVSSTNDKLTYNKANNPQQIADELRKLYKDDWRSFMF